MNLTRKVGLPAILILTLLWLACGDVFRPVATPIGRPGGDPSRFHYVVSVNQNNGQIGATSHVDVSGDTTFAKFPVGRGPVHAALIGSSTLIVANESADTLSFYSAPQCQLNSAGQASCTGTATGTPANVITLPSGSRPVFVSSGPGGKAFVVNAGTNSVGVISTGTFAQVASIPVGPNPVALVLSSNAAKLYCLNQGNGTVTVISTTDNTITGELTVGRSPVAGALSPDGSTLYVVNQGSGTISVINTVADTLVGTPVAVGSAPTHLFVDSHLSRLYVTNRASNTLSVLDISGSVPALIRTVAVGTAPVSVAVLGDGTRAYVANSGSNNVTVVDTSSLTVKTTVAVGENPVSVVTSPNDTVRVLVANFGPASNAICTGGVTADPAHPECYGFISDIDTRTDTVVAAGAGTGIPDGTTLAAGAPRPVFLLPSN